MGVASRRVEINNVNFAVLSILLLIFLKEEKIYVFHVFVENMYMGSCMYMAVQCTQDLQ